MTNQTRNRIWRCRDCPTVATTFEKAYRHLEATGHSMKVEIDVKKIVSLVGLVIFLLTASAHATIWNWNGTVDYGDSGGATTVTGSFETDLTTPPDYDFGNGGGAWTSGIKNISLNVGPNLYTRIAGGTLYAPVNGTGDTFHTQDLTLGAVEFSFANGGPTNPDNWWSITLWELGRAREVGGKVVSLYKDSYWPQGEPTLSNDPFDHDAAPTPEPYSLVMLGAGLLALGGFRKWRAR